MAGCYYYRPVADPGGGPTRHSFFLSPQSVSDDADPEALPFSVRVGRFFITPIVICFSRLWLSGTGDFVIRQDANYEVFLKAAMTRPGPQALITVSNHRSLLDDPPILSSLLPLSYAVRPRFLRVGLCSQEYCFAGPAIVNAFFGTGKSLPIWRGGGISQKLLTDYCRHVAAGEWSHLFPEGGVWQEVFLGGRKSPVSSMLPCNRLKWGIGRVIAHSPQTPIVIPFFHQGMEEVTPIDTKTRKTRHINIVGGHRVFVIFGPPVDFSDLIEAHEKEFGPLVKIQASTRTQQQALLLSSTLRQDPSPAEFELYRKITLRVESSLLVLNDEARRGIKNQSR